jgi:hypothetical protein
MNPANAATLRALLGPGQPEVSCETCFAELDRYVELELAEADAEAAVPGMAAHLEGCPACEQDRASLAAILTHGELPSSPPLNS